MKQLFSMGAIVALASCGTKSDTEIIIQSPDSTDFPVDSLGRPEFVLDSTFTVSDLLDTLSKITVEPVTH